MEKGELGGLEGLASSAAVRAWAAGGSRLALRQGETQGEELGHGRGLSCREWWTIPNSEPQNTIPDCSE